MACREPLQQLITAKEKLIEKGYRFPDPFNMDCDEKVSEKEIMKLCDADPGCTGYDYREDLNYGHLCTQVAYPGSSEKCCGYKLCKKPGGMCV